MSLLKDSASAGGSLQKCHWPGYSLAPSATVKYLSSDLELVAEEQAGSRI